MDDLDAHAQTTKPPYMEGLVGSMGLAAEINSLKDQIQELRKEQEAMQPIKGLVDAFSEVFTDHTQTYESQTLDLTNNMEEMKESMADVHKKLAEQAENRDQQIGEMKRNIDDIHMVIQSMSHDYEKNALEVEDDKRELSGRLDEMQGFYQTLRDEDNSRFEKVWESTQSMLTTVEDTAREMTQQASEWEEFRDEAINDFDKLRRIVDYLLAENFQDAGAEKEKALNVFSAPGGKTFGEKVRSGPMSPVGSFLRGMNNLVEAPLSPAPVMQTPVMQTPVLQTPGRNADEVASQVVDLEARLNDVLNRVQQDVKNLAEDCQRLQKDRGDLQSRIGDLELGSVKRQHIESLRDDLTAHQERVRNDQQELRTIAGQVTAQRQELNEVQQRQERHTAEIQSRIDSHANSLSDHQSQWRKELQTQALESQAQFRKELQSHGEANQSQWRLELQSQKVEKESQVATPSIVEGAKSEVAEDVEKRLDVVTKREFDEVVEQLWAAIAQVRANGGGGDDSSHKKLKEELDRNHEMVWEAVLQLQMKQHEQNKLKTTETTPLSAQLLAGPNMGPPLGTIQKGDALIAGTGGTPTRSGTTTPKRIQRIEVVGNPVSAYEIPRIDGTGAVMSRSSSRPGSPMTPGSYPRIVTQQLPLQATVTSIGSARSNQPSPGRVIQSPRVTGYAGPTIAKTPGTQAISSSVQGS